MAGEYKGLFVEFTKVSSAETRLVANQVLFDTILMHGSSPDDYTPVLAPALYDLDPEVQASACEGFAKLLLHDKLPTPDDVLLGLLTLHYHPQTRHNGRLRQCTSFFLHAYAWGAGRRHQGALRAVLVRCLTGLAAVEGVLPIPKLFDQLVYLCDQNFDKTDTPQTSSSSSALDWTGTVLDLLWAAVTTCSRDPAVASRLLSCAAKLDLSPGDDDGALRLREAALLVSLMLRQPPADRQALPALKRLAAGAAIADPGTVALPAERAQAVRQRVAGLCPTLLTTTTAPVEKRVRGRGGGAMRAVMTENILDNLGDILDD